MNEGYSQKECAELYERFKEQLANVSNEILLELAQDFSNDALVGIDSEDVISALKSDKGYKYFDLYRADASMFELEFQHLISKIQQKELDLQCVSGAYIVIKHGKHNSAVFYQCLNNIRSYLNDDKCTLVIGCFLDEQLADAIQVKLMFSGVSQN